MATSHRSETPRSRRRRATVSRVSIQGPDGYRHAGGRPDKQAIPPRSTDQSPGLAVVHERDEGFELVEYTALWGFLGGRHGSRMLAGGFPGIKRKTRYSSGLYFYDVRGHSSPVDFATYLKR